MGFFDKKEDVLEFQLTEYGKRLLEQGNLKPEFYAFYDDSVLYDTEAAGFKEAQNDAARRIKYDTPALKVQANTTGVETRVNQFLENVTSSAPGAFSNPISENSLAFVEAFQDTPHFSQKHFLTSDAIGNSDLKTPYAPAWHINCLANEISASQKYYTVNMTGSGVPLSDSVVRNIPQLDITLDYKNFFSTETEMSLLEDPTIVQLTEFISPNNVRLYVQEGYLVLDIQEENTTYLKENFDIEVFESGSDGSLTRLEFLKDDNLMIPTGDSSVEYYMNIYTDGEIPEEVAKSVGISVSALRGHSVRVQLNRDMYETENEEPC